MSIKQCLLIVVFLSFVFICYGQSTNIISTLEVYDIITKKRLIIYEEKGHFEAPNWSRDGNFFIVNSGGKLWKIRKDSSQKIDFNTGFADKCNNDHGISSDGTTLVVSHHDQPGISFEKSDYRTSKLYIIPIETRIPQLITSQSPSFWHGWSPDDKTLVYVGLRNGEYDIYSIDIGKNEEKQLTTAKGLDDGPDYSPDGKYIYYNSFQSGRMQIWRMNSNGEMKKQITHNAYSNWFPHPSPDGNHIVFLSYKEDQLQGHPAMKEILLQLYHISDKTTDSLFQLIGGQGTINVPSWSPDGKKFAFVSYRYSK